MEKITEKEVGSSFQENLAFLEKILPVQKSFDLIRRDIIIGGKDASFYFIDGFTKDEVMLKIMDSFKGIQEGDLS